MLHKFNSMLSKALSYDDLEWAGIKNVFETLYDIIKKKVTEDEILSRDVDEHMTEIADYITLRLYRTIFSNKIQSQKEYELFTKI